MTRLAIFIIHEQPQRLRQAATLLKAHKHLYVSHLMSSVQECLVRISPDNCDFILVSANLPTDDVRSLLKHVRQAASAAKVIVTDLPNDPKQILAYIAAGAVGYVLAQEGIGAWATQIAAVARGQPMVSPVMAAAMMRHLARLSKLAGGFVPHAQRYSTLTAREHEILLLLGEGHANQVIANRLIIGVGTVKNHVHRVLTKLNLSSRKATGMYLAYVK